MIDQHDTVNSMIVSSLERIETKLDAGLSDHTRRISKLEGGLSATQWIIGMAASAGALIAAVFFGEPVR